MHDPEQRARYFLNSGFVGDPDFETIEAARAFVSGGPNEQLLAALQEEPYKYGPGESDVLLDEPRETRG